MKIDPVKFEQKYVTIRDVSNIDQESFYKDIESGQLNEIYFVTEMLNSLKNNFKLLLRKILQLKEVRIRKPRAAWLMLPLNMMKDKIRLSLSTNVSKLKEIIQTGCYFSG